MDSSLSFKLLHIAHARQDADWVEGVLLPALGLTDGQYWTRAEDDIGALKLDEIERAVLACRYTLLVASSAARVDQWAQFATVLAQHLSIEDDRPRLLLVTRDFAPDSDRAKQLLPLRHRFLTCLDCSDPEQTSAALTKLAAQLALTVVEQPAQECPYPGLRMFGADEPDSFPRTDLFFGRDHEGRAIVDQLRAAPHRVLLVGPSGCGKSSLVRARVLPALRQAPDAMAIAVARPGQQPSAALRTALDVLDPQLGPAIDAYLRASDENEAAARNALAAAAGTAPRLLYVDQLEEVFLDHAGSIVERARFFAQLKALGHIPGLALLLGMRADFYGDLMRSAVWDEVKARRVELAPLRGAALRQAITRPAEMVGVHVEVDLVERLVREADADRAAEALPLLQVALERLWQHREWRYLSLDSYRQMVGGLKAADDRRGLDVVLARHADTSVAELAEPAQVLARRVLLDLVHLGEGRPDTRRRRTASDLQRAGDDLSGLHAVVQHLSTHRLISVGAAVATATALQEVAPSPVPTDVDESYVDLAHDTLITGWPALSNWIAEHRDKLRTQRRLEARATGGGLLAPSELGEFIAWVAWLDTPPGRALGATHALRELVRRSVARRRFRRRLFAGGSTVATAFAVVFGLQTLALRDERTKTQKSISKAAETAQAVVFELDDKLQDLTGASEVRETLVKRARALLADLRKLGPLDEHDRRADTAGQMTQADMLFERGHLRDAQAAYQVTLADAQRRIAADPKNPTWQRDLSVTYAKLGRVAMTAGRLDEARKWFEQALAVDEALAAAEPVSYRRQRDLAASYDQLGTVATSAGQLADARARFDKTLAIAKALVEVDPSNQRWQRDLALAYRRQADLAESAGHLEDARQHLERAHAIDKNLVAADSSNATWRRDLSTTLVRLGDIAMSSARLDDARTMLNEALAMRRALAAASATNTAWALDVSTAYSKLGKVAMLAGNLEEARTWLDRSLEADQTLVSSDATNATWQQNLCISNLHRADVEMSIGNPHDARPRLERALGIAVQLSSSDPANQDWQRMLSDAYNALGELAASAEQFAEAWTWFERALAIRKRLAETDPANATWQRALAQAQASFGDVAAAMDKLGEARDHYEDALELAQHVAAANPANTIWQRDVSTYQAKLGEIAKATGDLLKAQKLFERAVAIEQTLVDAQPANAALVRDLVVSYGQLGDLAIAANRLDEARGWFTRAIAAVKPLVDADPSNPLWQHEAVIGYRKLGAVASSAGNLEDARAWLERARAVGTKLVDADPSNSARRRELSTSYNQVGELALSAGALDEARSAFEQSRALRQALLTRDPGNAAWQRDLSFTYDRLGAVAVAAEKLDDARSWFEKSLAIGEALATADPANTARKRDLSATYERLGTVSISSGKLADARAWFEKSLAIAKGLATTDPTNNDWQRSVWLCYVRLGELAQLAGKPDDAETWLKKALSVSQSLALVPGAGVAAVQDLALSYDRLGELAEVAQRYVDAQTWFEKAFDIDRKLADGDHANTALQHELSVSARKLGDVAAAARKLDIAQRWFTTSLTIRQALADAEPTNAARQRDLCIILVTIAQVVPRPKEAIYWVSRAEPVCRRLLRDPSLRDDSQLAQIEAAMTEIKTRTKITPKP